MADLVPLALAKDHLRVTWADGDPRDAYLIATLAHAQTQIIVRCERSDYGRTQTPLWTDPDTVPPNVQRAILLQLGELMDYRGDERDGLGPLRADGVELNPRIEALIRVYSDPVAG